MNGLLETFQPEILLSVPDSTCLQTSLTFKEPHLSLVGLLSELNALCDI